MKYEVQAINLDKFREVWPHQRGLLGTIHNNHLEAAGLGVGTYNLSVTNRRRQSQPWVLLLLEEKPYVRLHLEYWQSESDVRKVVV